MKKISFTELRNNAKRYFDSVEKGESVEIYRHGVPIAVIQPLNNKAKSRWKKSAPLTISGADLSAAVIEDRYSR